MKEIEQEKMYRRGEMYILHRFFNCTKETLLYRSTFVAIESV